MSTRSYVHGATETPLLGTTVGELLDATQERWGAHDALIVPHQDIRWTYSEFKQRVDALAAGFIAHGLVVGDRIGIWAPNCAEWVVTQFATAKAGLILVNINPAYRLSEVEYALAHTGCRAVIAEPEFKGSDYIAMLETLVPGLEDFEPGALTSQALPELRSLISLDEVHRPGWSRLADIAQNGDANQTSLDDVSASLQFDDAINIQFTSGTTGRPKAATLTHHNIVNNAFFSAQRMELSSKDKLCIPVPMYHCFGMVLGTLACVAHGAAMVLPSMGFDAGAVIAAIENERCTAIHGVPTMFIAELEHPRFAECDTSSLRTGIIAGAPCPVELMRRLLDEMNLREITIAYGMTETGPVSFQTSPRDSVERRVETVGRVLPHTEIKIVDDSGRVVPVGEAGELLTRGYCVMLGYWGETEKTAETIDSARWLHSGDIAVLDAEGYCKIVGRKKDMVIRGGENIFPAEIEDFLFQHPKVEQAEVVGVPDARLGEELCAWIRLRSDEDADAEEIRDFCKGKIAHFKIPRYVLFVDEFPVTITGKVQKFKMREKSVELLGL